MFSLSLSLSHTHTPDSHKNIYGVSLRCWTFWPALQHQSQLPRRPPKPIRRGVKTKGPSQGTAVRSDSSEHSRSTVPAHEMALPWGTTPPREHFQSRPCIWYACVAGRCGPTRGTQRRRDPQEARILAHSHRHQASRQHSRKSLVDCASRPSLGASASPATANQPHNRPGPAYRTVAQRHVFGRLLQSSMEYAKVDLTDHTLHPQNAIEPPDVRLGHWADFARGAPRR